MSWAANMLKNTYFCRNKQEKKGGAEGQQVSMRHAVIFLWILHYCYGAGGVLTALLSLAVPSLNPLLGSVPNSNNNFGTKLEEWALFTFPLPRQQEGLGSLSWEEASFKLNNLNLRVRRCQGSGKPVGDSVPWAVWARFEGWMQCNEPRLITFIFTFIFLGTLPSDLAPTLRRADVWRRATDISVQGWGRLWPCFWAPRAASLPFLLCSMVLLFVFV